MDKAFLAGRILFSFYFIKSGVNHFLKLEGMTGYAASKGVPLPELAVIVTGILLFTGGLSILTGYFPKIGAYLLIAFFIPVSSWSNFSIDTWVSISVILRIFAFLLLDLNTPGTVVKDCAAR